jgi:hypothetical protein
VARSHAIWLLINPAKVATTGPLAAFTVKHECVSWLDRHYAAGLKLYRMDDNPSDYRQEPTVTELDLDEFLKEAKARDERARTADEIWRASVSFRRTTQDV